MRETAEGGGMPIFYCSCGPVNTSRVSMAPERTKKIAETPPHGKVFRHEVTIRPSVPALDGVGKRQPGQTEPISRLKLTN
jgi:hypothetical protein